MYKFSEGGGEKFLFFLCGSTSNKTVKSSFGILYFFFYKKIWFGEYRPFLIYKEIRFQTTFLKAPFLALSRIFNCLNFRKCFSKASIVVPLSERFEIFSLYRLFQLSISEIFLDISSLKNRISYLRKVSLSLSLVFRKRHSKLIGYSFNLSSENSMPSILIPSVTDKKLDIKTSVLTEPIEIIDGSKSFILSNDFMRIREILSSGIWKRKNISASNLCRAIFLRILLKNLKGLSLLLKTKNLGTKSQD